MLSFRPSPVTWPVWALICSAAMLAAAHAFERFGNFLPCPLCLRQREVYWAAISVAIVSLVVMRLWPAYRLTIAFNLILGLVFLTGAVIAGYHTGVEWGWWQGPADCSGAPGDALSGSLSQIDFDKRYATVSCSDAAWRMFGISMAGYNTLVSLALAGLSSLFAISALQSAPTPDESFDV